MTLLDRLLVVVRVRREQRLRLRAQHDSDRAKLAAKIEGSKIPDITVDLRAIGKAAVIVAMDAERAFMQFARAATKAFKVDDDG